MVLVTVYYLVDYIDCKLTLTLASAKIGSTALIIILDHGCFFYSAIKF